MVRFQAVKNFLSANSLEDSIGGIMIYPGLLLEAIREVKVIHRLKKKRNSGGVNLLIHLVINVVIKLIKIKNISFK